MLGRVTRLEAQPTDAELVEAARAGDRSAKEALFRRHVRSAGERAYRLLGRDQELEDVVQESFAQAFAGLLQLEDPRAFAGWLSAIVTGTAIGVIRKRRLLARLGIVRAEPVQLEALIAHSAPPDVVAELRGVYGVIHELPAAQQVVLILRRVEQLTLVEIAEQTGFSLATVKRRLVAAEARLAKGVGLGTRKS
ncbi:MAG TPA: RNA polymerase sigma factor [Polyangiaceae bacterium]|nr:RNA polymerase sigma factor [Polyangiaceae bacterium]